MSASAPAELPEARAFAFHLSNSADVQASAEALFSFLDDPRRLSSHMEKSSWMMLGSSMTLDLDNRQGKAIGAEIVLRGKMMGIPLLVREVVTERTPPYRKAWQTVGEQQMLVIERYRMGFEVSEARASSRLTVFIDYDLPKAPFVKILGFLFGKFYARWCTKKMVADAASHFKSAI